MTNETITLLFKAFIAQFALISLAISFYMALSLLAGRKVFNGLSLNTKTRFSYFKKVLASQKVGHFDIVEIVIGLTILSFGILSLPLTDSFLFQGQLLNTDIITSDHTLWMFCAFCLALLFYILGIEGKDKESYALFVFFIVCFSLLVPLVYGTASLRYIIYNQAGGFTALGIARFPLMAACLLFVAVIVNKKLALKLHDFYLANSVQKTSYLDSLLNLGLLFYMNLMFVYLFLGGYSSFASLSFITDFIPILLVVIQVLSLVVKLFFVTLVTFTIQKFIPYSNPLMQVKILKLVVVILIFSTIILNALIRLDREGVLKWPV